MKKKIFNLLMIVMAMLCLTACGKSENKEHSIFSNKLKTSDLSIEDFTVETKKVKRYGKDNYVATFTNNSNYPVILFQMDYEPKEGVSDSELHVFKEFMKEHEEYINDGPINGVILRTSEEKYVKKGESIENSLVHVGYDDASWYNVATKSQFELMRPKELQIGIIGKDDVLYLAYYNYDDKEWILDEETKKMNTWPKTKLSKEIVKPKADYIALNSDLTDEEELDVYAYGIKKEYLKEYIKEIQEKGFKVESVEDSDDSYFDTYETKDGLDIMISYDEETEVLNVDLDKESDE